jgi:hypothetical protein
MPKSTGTTTPPAAYAAAFDEVPVVLLREGEPRKTVGRDVGKN